MKVGEKHYRSIWSTAYGRIRYVDQSKLPFKFKVEEAKCFDDAADIIRTMKVRGAPAIGVMAAYGMYLAAKEVMDMQQARNILIKTRPTAINLKYAVDYVVKDANKNGYHAMAVLDAANCYADTEVERCRQIGINGLDIIRESYKRTGRTVQIMTHCNAGWLACVDYGTALAPIYLAHQEGIPIHVWVSETRPRNQGSRLTAWELAQEGIQHTVMADNAAGWLMTEGFVDMVIVGSDRTTKRGLVVNKVGTYLKALAAKQSQIPFYVALPSSTIDMGAPMADRIPIEQRPAEEVQYMEGWKGHKVESILTLPPNSPVFNPAFDVTPGNLVTALITEKGVCKPTEQAISKMMADG